MKARGRSRIGEALVEQNLVTENDIAIALARQRESGRRLGETLFEMGAISSFDLTRVLAERQGIEFVDLDRLDVEPAATARVPIELAQQYGAVALGADGTRLRVAMVNPTDPYALDDLASVTGMEIDPVMADPAQILARTSARSTATDAAPNIRGAREPIASGEPVVRDAAIPGAPRPGSADPVATRVGREIVRLANARAAFADSANALLSSIARDVWRDQYLLAHRNLAEFLTNRRLSTGAAAFAPGFPGDDAQLSQAVARLGAQAQWIDRYLAGPACDSPVEDDLPDGRLEEMHRDLQDVLRAFNEALDPAHVEAFAAALPHSLTTRTAASS